MRSKPTRDPPSTQTEAALCSGHGHTGHEQTSSRDSSWSCAKCWCSKSWAEWFMNHEQTEPQQNWNILHETELDRWMDGQMDKWMDGWGWMDGWMDGWTDGGMDGWVDDGQMDGSRYSNIRLVDLMIEYGIGFAIIVFKNVPFISVLMRWWRVHVSRGWHCQ